MSLTEMRFVTAAVANEAPFARATSTCASCRRQTPTLAWGNGHGNGDLPADKCPHCSRPIEATDEPVIVDADRFHDHCWRRLTSDATVRVSRALSRRSLELIRQSRKRMGFDPGSLSEA